MEEEEGKDTEWRWEDAVARVFAHGAVADCLRAACVCRSWRLASERLEAWAGVVLSARRSADDHNLHGPVAAEKGARPLPPAGDPNSVVSMGDAVLESLTLKLRRVGELHCISSVPPPRGEGGGVAISRGRSPLHLRKIEFGGHGYWWLCYNTGEFGWFDKEHTTTFAVGLKVWAPCPLMCRWYSEPRGLDDVHDVAGLSVLELGAGVGMLGVSIAARARRVCVTDIDPCVLRIAAVNARINQAANVDVRKLAFGRDYAVPFREEHGRFDRVLAADIVYSTSVVRPVFESVNELLTETGVFSFGFVDRDDRFGLEIEAAAWDFGFVAVRPPCFLAEALGDKVRPRTDRNDAAGMLMELKRVLERIPKGGACLGEAGESVQLLEYCRVGLQARSAKCGTVGGGSLDELD